ncbi:MAG TPA: type 4a pilus biogenesis protein PilO [Acidimicrobiales bacterium]|nr:type 4a pilus biogenesis protein PilO [Acidimicrobiales bacterium]
MTSTRRLPILSAAAALVLVLIWYVAMFSPQQKNIQKAHKANAAATQKADQLQSQASQLEILVKEIPADNARFAQLEASLPDNPQFDQALNLLHQAAVQTGVTVTNVTPSTPVGASTGGNSAASAPSAGIPSINLTMSIQGSGQQAEAFLSALNALPRTVVIDKVSIGGGTGGTMSIAARIFYAGKPTP